MAILNARHKRPELCLLRNPGQVAEGAVAFEHGLLGLSYHLYLEEVVHYPQAVEPGLVGGLADLRQLRAYLFRPIRPGETGDLQSNTHVSNSSLKPAASE